MADIFKQARLPTGIDALDRQLDGGLPGGTVLAFTAPPASQSELLLYELCATRETLYLTTDRADHAVADALRRSAVPMESPQIQYVDSSAPLDDAARIARDVGEGMNLIIDPVDTLERAERGRYSRFLNELQNHMHNTGSIAALHCLRGNDVPPLRTTTEHLADVVFDLSVTRAGAELETRLAVPKFRGGEALRETIKLELADRVRVDTSRDIA